MVFHTCGNPRTQELYLPKVLPARRFAPGASHKDDACATFLHAHGLTCCRPSCAIFGRKMFLGLGGGCGGGGGVGGG